MIVKKAKLCKEYINHIQECEKLYKNSPTYDKKLAYDTDYYMSMDRKRIELHNELMKAFNISRWQCRGITDNLDKINYDYARLYVELQCVENGSASAMATYSDKDFEENGRDYDYQKHVLSRSKQGVKCPALYEFVKRFNKIDEDNL